MRRYTEKAQSKIWQYDLNNILESLLYTRMISPSSKLRISEEVADYYKWKSLESHQVHHSLSIFAKEMKYIQSQLYDRTMKQKRQCVTAEALMAVLHFEVTF